MAENRPQAADGGGPRPARQFVVPPPQHNFEEAAKRALEAVRKQPAEQLEWLGARGAGQHWTIRVLDGDLSVDLDAGTVRTNGAAAVAAAWRILALHYLAAPGRPVQGLPEVSFADLPGGRTYARVYRQRVIERLCATVGWESSGLSRACQALGGSAVAVGDLGFDFQVFPRIGVRLVWYAGDDELHPDATVLYPGNIGSVMEIEDVVVMAERLVSRLCGRPW